MTAVIILKGISSLPREIGDVEAWRRLMQAEKARGITYVVLAGAEPSLVPELLKVCYQEMPLGSIATNGFKKIPESVGYKIHISVWGNDETSLRIRKARNLLKKQVENYKNDPRAVFVYTFTRENIDEVNEVAEELVADGCKLTFNVFSSPVGYTGPLRHDDESLQRTKQMMIALLNKYPQNILFSVYNAVAHTHKKAFARSLQLFLSPPESFAGYGSGKVFPAIQNGLELGQVGCLLRAGYGL